MAASDSAHDGRSAEEVRDERFIAALCRNARLQNEEIHKQRERLRKEIREIQERSYAVEGRYWREYHERLAGIIDANSKWSTRRWISEFADNEKKVADAVDKAQAKLGEVARIRQDELAAVDKQFWGAWRKHVDVMRGLSPLPPTSGSTPAAMLPGVSSQPAADTQTSGSAQPAAHSDGNGTSQRESNMHSTTGQKQSVSGNSCPTTSTKTANAQHRCISQPVTTPVLPSHVSSPSPNNIPTTASTQRDQVQNNGRKIRARSLTPTSLTPKSSSTGVESQYKSSQEPADNACSAKPHMTTPAESHHQETSAAVGPVTQPTPPTLSGPTTLQGQGGIFSGVTDPVVGEIYQGFYKDARYQGWWMCTPLPWEAWEREIGINYSFHHADLFKDLPGCYTVGRVRAKPRGRRMKPVITGWAEGFEAGGPRAEERVFPMLFFDDVPGEPGNFRFPDSPAKVFTFPRRALKALPAEWVSAADLRPFGVDVGRPVLGRETAGRFRERVRARRALQAQKKLGTPGKKFSRAGTPAAAEAGSPPEDTLEAKKKLGTPRRIKTGPPAAVESSPPVEITTREDIEMADAESLSGATAVDETVGPLDVLEAPKAPASPAGKSPASGSERSWRVVILGEEP